MTDDRLILAIGRLEQAVSTLESRLPGVLVTARKDEDDGLRERHDALRARTAAAVERLSQLLETAGNG